MSKIGGAIERIDDPFARSGFTTLTGNNSGLFGENRMVRIATPDGIDDKRFTFLIGSSDEVGAAFQLDELFAIGVVLEYVTGRSGQFNGEFQVLHFDLIHSRAWLRGRHRFHQFQESLVRLQFGERGLAFQLFRISEPALHSFVQK